MLEDLEHILSTTSDRDTFKLAALLKQEVGRRLAFEEALRAYLDRGPGNPFAASRALLDFLEADLAAEPSTTLGGPMPTTNRRDAAYRALRGHGGRA